MVKRAYRHPEGDVSSSNYVCMSSITPIWSGPEAEPELGTAPGYSATSMEGRPKPHGLSTESVMAWDQVGQYQCNEHDLKGVTEVKGC